MRTPLLAVGLTFAVCAPAIAMEPTTFSMVRAEIDASADDIFTWEGDAWVGGDLNKLWLKTEGEIEDGTTHEAEIQALWSRKVADFWDLQTGVRVDLEPDPTSYLAFGVQGLAPYRFDTEATAFVSEKGVLSARLYQSIDFHFTQRLIAEPYVEINASAEDVPEREIGAGLTDAELGLQVRYEITRKFAPYVDFVWRSALGETAALSRDRGADVETGAVRAGLRFWF